jgi:chromosome segregation ATPase
MKSAAEIIQDMQYEICSKCGLAESDSTYAAAKSIYEQILTAIQQETPAPSPVEGCKWAADVELPTPAQGEEWKEIKEKFNAKLRALRSESGNWQFDAHVYLDGFTDGYDWLKPIAQQQNASLQAENERLREERNKRGRFLTALEEQFTAAQEKIERLKEEVKRISDERNEWKHLAVTTSRIRRNETFNHESKVAELEKQLAEAKEEREESNEVLHSCLSMIRSLTK